MKTNELYLTAPRKGVAESIEQVCAQAGTTPSAYMKSLYALRMAGPNSEDLARAELLHKGAIAACEDRWMAFVEVPHGSQSARAMASYGVCIGVLAGVATTLPVIQVTASEVKMIGAGVKSATKEEMIEAAMARYPDAPWPTKMVKGVKTPIAGKCEHMADAIFAIEAGLATDEFRQMIAMYKSTPFYKRALVSNEA